LEVVESRWLVRTEEIMSLERILVPVDIAKWPVEVFSMTNTIANHPNAAVTLVHVVTLNIAVPETRVYEEIGAFGQGFGKRILPRAANRRGVRRGTGTASRRRLSRRGVYGR
jgi:hypothetical protein